MNARHEVYKDYEYWLGKLMEEPRNEWVSGNVHGLWTALHLIDCQEHEIEITQKPTCPCHICKFSRERKA